MRCLVLALVLGVVCLGGAEESGKKEKKRQLAVQVIETVAHRVSDGTIELDGCVRNTGERPIKGLIIIFDFMAPGGAVISTQKWETEGLLERGKEAFYEAKLDDQVRAVRYRVGATDQDGRELHVTKPGPYVID